MNDSTALTQDMVNEITAWRRDLHMHPELGFDEHRTSELVAEKLRGFGLEVHENVGKTGVVGVLRRGDGRKCIGMRADMDALAISEANTFPHKSQHNGRMHACGHDGHTAMLLGAAKVLAEAGDFDGTAVFLFQPAEEHGQGALAMIEDGLFERFPMEAVYAIHNMPSLKAGNFALRPGPIMACEDNFEISIFGKGGHAAQPHLSIDPIVIGAEVVLALQSVVSRVLIPTDNAVLSVTDFAVEATRNVIPETVVLRGDTRSFTPDVQDRMEATMARLVAGICEAHGAEHAFSYSHEFASTINSPAEAAIAAQVAASVVGAESVDASYPALMASEDFGYMLQRRPGCYVLLGNGGDGPGGCGLHSPHYDFNDDIAPTGIAFWVNLVQSQLVS
ncbi:MAG: amidohydrolase [Rhodospirillaceae bacterium]|nr:amidohydrolase [Rhodospirillaceae bacterium]